MHHLRQHQRLLPQPTQTWPEQAPVPPEPLQAWQVQPEAVTLQLSQVARQPLPDQDLKQRELALPIRC